MASDRAQILITAVDQTRAALASVKGNLEGLSAAASKVSGVLASLGVALSVGALVAAGRAALNTADDLAKLAQKTGLSVESLSLLKPIAEQAGVSLEGLAKGMQRLATSMIEAAGGSQAQAEVFRRLGVSVTDAAGQIRPTEQVLLDLSDAFASMPDGAEKSALAVRLFGKSGVELIPFLNQGRAGIEQLKEQFKALGIEISGDTARAAEKFNDTLDTVKQALQGIAMRIAEAALPALQQLADALVVAASHGSEITTVVRVLGEVIFAALAVKGATAVAALLQSVTVLKAAFMRFLPVLAAVAVWEVGSGIVQAIQDIRETDRMLDQLARQRENLALLTQAMDELAANGVVSVKTQMALAALAAERLKETLPATADALRGIQGAATQAGEAIRQSLDAEAKKAAETVKQLATTHQKVASDIKAIWDARVAAIEANYKRQEAAAQNSARSESAAIRDTTRALVNAERDKLTAVEAGARQAEATWRTTYAQAVALARAAGQDVQAVERQAVDARIALYRQLESAYRATVDRLIAEEQRHLQAAKAADDARLNLRLSVEDRIRELSRRGMDEYAAYQDRLRQIDEKQAQARDALAAGNYEQARKLAEEAIALAERSASAVTKQVEQNGKAITQTLVSEGQAAATAIAEIKDAAGIADAALDGLGDAHRRAASAAGDGADQAKRALASVTSELGKLREQLLAQDTLKLEVDLDAARDGIARIKALTEAETLIAQIQIDTREARASLEKLQADVDNLSLLATVEVDSRQVLDDIDRLKRTLTDVGVDIPALVSFDQPRQALAAFATDAKIVLTAPTEATHTPNPDLSRYRAAVSELSRPTSSTHTIYVSRVQTNAQGGLIQRLAEGGQAVTGAFRRVAGRVLGPGTETSDSVPALLSHGEFVIRAASVRRFGEGFFAALNAGLLPALPRFAVGGAAATTLRSVIGHADTGSASAREVVDLRFHVGGKTHAVQSSRETAMHLAQALRELSRGA
jgi:hypothetical protein